MQHQKLLFFVVSCLLFSGCKDWFDIVEDFSFQQEFSVRTDHMSFSESEVVDLCSKSSVVNKHVEKISRVNVKVVRLSLKAHNGSLSQELTYASLGIAQSNGTNQALLSHLFGSNLNTLLQEPLSLSLDAEGIAMINALIKTSPDALMLLFDGTLNEGPADFVMVLEFSGSITANPLN